MERRDLTLRAACGRTLHLHGPVDVRATLHALADRPEAAAPPDFYGMDGAVARVEARTAELLGKPAATYFVKGVTAQLAALRAVTRTRAGTVVIPALGHMAVEEADSPDDLLDAPVIRLGDNAPYALADVEALDAPPALCVVELPLRRAAYRLLPWADLQALSDGCRARGVHLHLDGARLWEAAAGYGVPPATVAALADSVYVSFYKGLGGLAGAALAGEPALLDAVAVWKTRLGGDLHTAFPYALSALDGLDRRLPRMADYLERARRLARLLVERGHAVTPAMPDVNAFRLTLPGMPEALAEANRQVARRDCVWLFNGFRPARLAAHSEAEIAIGDAAMALGDDEICDWIDALCAATRLAG